MFIDNLKCALLYILPQHLISRIVYAATRWETRLKNPVTRWFVNFFDVDMADAIETDPTAFKSFNAFFTRALKPEARSIAAGDHVIASPVDGTISQVGEIKDGRILQAKGRDYSVSEFLLNEETAKHFQQGSFITLYLAPRDYHRIHMPMAGRLKSMTHVPGRLFSVAPFTVRALKKLFARNERVNNLFETDHGLLLLSQVAAINVAAVETVWAGLITPPAGVSIHTTDYNNGDISLEKGQEMGRFNMGSTVILLFEHQVDWVAEATADAPVQLGQALGSIN
ncbi:MAG: phosphatidylserine decarboxylase [Gammaproteobacteria bacterium]|nr:phosphatidylserine decarboxylase [Gammaproteobacteria bacterium]